jgi:hypothetical protein
MRRGRGDPRWDDGPEWDKREDEQPDDRTRLVVVTASGVTVVLACPYCREQGTHAPNCWRPR